MATCAPKHPLTHCEKYGHTWVASVSAGFEVCAYVGGKGRTCKAGQAHTGGQAMRFSTSSCHGCAYYKRERGERRS